MRTKLKRLIWAILLVAFALGSQAQSIDLTVMADNAQVHGVSVTVQYKGPLREAGETNNEGYLRLDLQRLLGQRVPDRDAVTLSFRKQGFDPVNRLFTVGTSSALSVSMTSRTAAASQLTQADQTALAPLRNLGTNGPLLLLPYELKGIAEPDQVNQRLRASLERRIVTYVQSVAGARTAELGVRLVGVAGSRDVSQMQAYGRYSNVLAVIGGEAKTPRGGSMQIESMYVIIPKLQAFEPPVAYVDEFVTEGEINSAALHRRLKRAWGRLTVLALAMRDINAAPAAPGSERKAALVKVRQYLGAEQSSGGPNSDEYLKEIKDLLTYLDREIK